MHKKVHIKEMVQVMKDEDIGTLPNVDTAIISEPVT